MVKHLLGAIEKTVEDKLSERLALRDRFASEKKMYEQMKEDEKSKLRQIVTAYDGSGCYKQPEKPKAKLWVAEVVLPKDGSNKPVYFFHCPDATTGSTKGITYGKQYLYSGRGFVSTDNPATAILLQQLLNDGQLTVQPFTNETKQ